MFIPPPIVNGTPVNGAFTEVGSLLVDYGDSSHLICTATLIQEDVVITAGHCAQQINSQMNNGQSVYFTPFDEIDLDSTIDINSILVKESIIHPDFDESLNNDLALVFLEEGLEISVSRMSVAVPDVTWQNELFTFVGTGNTGETANDEGIKQQTEIPYYDNDDMFHYAIDQSENGSTNLCYGDSGGPMFRVDEDGGYSLVGVNSFVFSITDDDLPCSKGGTGSIRIDMYASWISDELGVSLDDEYFTDIDFEEYTDMEDTGSLEDDVENPPKSGCDTIQGSFGHIPFLLLPFVLVILNRRMHM